MTDALRPRTTKELSEIRLQCETTEMKKLYDVPRETGLVEAAEAILKGSPIKLESLICSGFRSSSSMRATVRTNVIQIIADRIWRSKRAKHWVNNSLADGRIRIRTVLAPSTEATAEQTTKFTLYDDREYSIPHLENTKYKILAIQYGCDELGILNRCIDIPLYFYFQREVIYGMYLQRVHARNKEIVNKALKESWKRLVKPWMEQAVWNRLCALAEEEARPAKFAENFRNMLLCPPLLGQSIMAISPSNARLCSVAIVDSSGKFLHGSTFYLNQPVEAKRKISELLHVFGIRRIVLGRGMHCRETQKFISTCIQNQDFDPTNIQTVVVSECGASLDAVSAITKEKFPGHEAGIVMAICIARRTLDPLSELVKLDSKHIGIGSYRQTHDKNVEKIKELIIEECVSFAGVDANTASVYLLSRVAGLNRKLAERIVEYRVSNAISSREDLLSIKGLAKTRYNQCAGFLRIYSIGGSAAWVKSNLNEGPRLFQRGKLDSTLVHPEQYALANQILSKTGLTTNEIGSTECIEKFKGVNPTDLAGKVSAAVETVKLICDVLSQPLGKDYRKRFVSERFGQVVPDPESLKPGMDICGEVRNVTGFGTLVDICANQDAYVPRWELAEWKGAEPKVGDFVRIRLISCSSDKLRSIILDKFN